MNIKTYSVLVLILIVLSCSTEKRLQRAINKHGQKESIEYILDKYKEYIPKKDTLIYVTVRDTIPLIVESDTLMDTFKCDEDSFIIENERLKVQIKKIERNKYIVAGTIKRDTIYKEVVIHDTIKVSLPNVLLEDKENTSAQKERNNCILIIVLIILIILSVILYYYLISRSTTSRSPSEENPSK